MTRLRQPERAGARHARRRRRRPVPLEALAWAVKLVGEHADEWLTDLREAMAEVDKLRSEGPEL